MSNHTRLSIFLISLTLAACGTRTATPTPTVVPLPSVTPPAQQASAPPTVMPIPSIAPQTSNGLTLRADNFRYTDYRPNKKQYLADLCYTLPTATEWMPHDITLHYTQGQIIATGIEILPASSPTDRCLALSFHLPVTADLSHIQLVIRALVGAPDAAQVCDSFYPTVQRYLDSQTTGVTVHCEQGELGPLVGPWIYPNTLTRAEAQQIIETASAQVIEADYTHPGPWVFNLTAADFIYQAPLTLLAAQTQPSAELAFMIDNFQHALFPPSVDVCYQLLSDSNWGIWSATLEAGNTEIDFDGYERLTHPQPDSNGRRCDTLTFSNLPPDFDFTHATLNIFSIGAPPFDEAIGCGPYLQKLQATLDARYPGLQADCGHETWGWYLKVLQRPASLTEAQANMLIYRDDLYTLKGWWAFPLTH